MKTADWVQIGALAAISYIAYQKYGRTKSPATTPTTSTLPSTTAVDFGLANPNDPNWGDSAQGQGFVDQLITQATGGLIL